MPTSGSGRSARLDLSPAANAAGSTQRRDDSSTRFIATMVMRFNGWEAQSKLLMKLRRRIGLPQPFIGRIADGVGGGQARLYVPQFHQLPMNFLSCG